MGKPTTPHFDVPKVPIGVLAARGVAAWLVPGAGHWMMGLRRQAVVLAVCILGLFWVGESVLSENKAVSRKTSPVFFWGQLGNGGSTLLASLFWGEPETPESNDQIDTDLPPHLHLGLLCTIISGLLNVLAVLHVIDPLSSLEARLALDPASARLGSQERTPS